MRCMHRNKVKFYYALYEGREGLTDEYGNATGEYAVIYSNPLPCWANISPARGETETRQFGDNEFYDKVIIGDLGFPLIDEHSILWVDVMPDIKADGSTDTPHDYEVRKVGKSLNVVSVAISKVNVDG